MHTLTVVCETPTMVRQAPRIPSFPVSPGDARTANDEDGQQAQRDRKQDGKDNQRNAVDANAASIRYEACKSAIREHHCRSPTLRITRIIKYCNLNSFEIVRHFIAYMHNCILMVSMVSKMCRPIAIMHR